MKPGTFVSIGPATRDERFGSPIVIAGLLAFVLGTLVAIHLTLPAWKNAGHVPAPSLDLHASPAGEYYRISWSRAAIERLQPQQGVLFIVDDGAARSLDLSLAELRSGALTYPVTSTDVRFRLEISSSKGERVSESVIVLGGEPSLARAGSQQGEDQIGSAFGYSERAERKKEPVQNLSLPQTTAALASKALPAVMPDIDAGRVGASPSVLTADSSSSKTPSSTPVVLAPPSVLNVAPTPHTGIDLSNLLGPGEAVTYTEQQAEQQEPPKTRAIPTLAQAVKQFQPQVSRDLRALITSRQQIQLRVTINELGRVRSATVVSQNGSVIGLLTEISLDAARRWVFKPAQVDGRTVPSEHIITFVFRPARD